VGLSAADLEVVQLDAMLHDLGKIGIRENALYKEGVLTPGEYEHIKEDVTLGVGILEPLKDLKPNVTPSRGSHGPSRGELAS